MHKEILSDEQTALLPLLQKVSNKFGLVGGTAAALQIGHRRSIDFDFFTHQEFENQDMSKVVSRFGKIKKVLVNKFGEFTVIIGNVKVTFFNYPFKIEYNKNFDNLIKMPDILTLAAMKAYALGRRAKWKDYVDLYFILKDFHPIYKIVKKCRQIFRSEFNEKLFRVQLSYFDDINYDEKIEFLPGFHTNDAVIKKSLADHSTL